jgi:hypothetical protein
MGGRAGNGQALNAGPRPRKGVLQTGLSPHAVLRAGATLRLHNITLYLEDGVRLVATPLDGVPAVLPAFIQLAPRASLIMGPGGSPCWRTCLEGDLPPTMGRMARLEPETGAARALGLQHTPS